MGRRKEASMGVHGGELGVKEQLGHGRGVVLGQRKRLEGGARAWEVVEEVLGDVARGRRW